MVAIATDTPPDPATLLQLLAARDAVLRAKDLLIEKLKLQIAALRRHRFGTKSEALDHAISQLELMLEEAEIQAASQRERDTPDAPSVPLDPKSHPKRRPLPDHLPREEIVLSLGETCGQCGGRLRRIGEDVCETLEYVPARFKVIRTIRPKLACRCCDGVLQAAAPTMPIERGRPGPGLLAHVLVSKYADHLPLYRQSQMYAREGVDLERSTLADWVGKSTMSNSVIKSGAYPALSGRQVRCGMRQSIPSSSMASCAWLIVTRPFVGGGQATADAAAMERSG